MLATINMPKVQAPFGVSLLHPVLIIQGYDQNYMIYIQPKYNLLKCYCLGDLVDCQGNQYSKNLENSNATVSLASIGQYSELKPYSTTHF